MAFRGDCDSVLFVLISNMSRLVEIPQFTVRIRRKVLLKNCQHFERAACRHIRASERSYKSTLDAPPDDRPHHASRLEGSLSMYLEIEERHRHYCGISCVRMDFL